MATLVRENGGSTHRSLHIKGIDARCEKTNTVMLKC
jgi:hypothetical protein